MAQRPLVHLLEMTDLVKVCFRFADEDKKKSLQIPKKYLQEIPFFLQWLGSSFTDKDNMDVDLSSLRHFHIDQSDVVTYFKIKKALVDGDEVETPGTFGTFHLADFFMDDDFKTRVSLPKLETSDDYGLLPESYVETMITEYINSLKKVWEQKAIKKITLSGLYRMCPQGCWNDPSADHWGSQWSTEELHDFLHNDPSWSTSRCYTHSLLYSRVGSPTITKILPSRVGKTYISRLNVFMKRNPALAEFMWNFKDWREYLLSPAFLNVKKKKRQLLETEFSDIPSVLQGKNKTLDHQLEKILREDSQLVSWRREVAKRDRDYNNANKLGFVYGAYQEDPLEFQEKYDMLRAKIAERVKNLTSEYQRKKANDAPKVVKAGWYT